MKSFIKNLVYDKTLVDKIKEVNMPKELLYNQLISGKITMKEYLKAV